MYSKNYRVHSKASCCYYCVTIKQLLIKSFNYYFLNICYSSSITAFSRSMTMNKMVWETARALAGSTHVNRYLQCVGLQVGTDGAGAPRPPLGFPKGRAFESNPRTGATLPAGGGEGGCADPGHSVNKARARWTFVQTSWRFSGISTYLCTSGLLKVWSSLDLLPFAVRQWFSIHCHLPSVTYVSLFISFLLLFIYIYFFLPLSAESGYTILPSPFKIQTQLSKLTVELKVLSPAMLAFNLGLY